MPTRGVWGISLGDSAQQRVHTRLYGAVLTAANLAAQVTAWGALEAAVIGVSNGNEQAVVLGNQTVPANPVFPATGVSFRSRKMAISYHDTANGKRYTATIGTFDATKVTFLAGTRNIDFSSGAAQTLANAFVAVVLTKDGNTPAIDRMREVGRNI